MIKNPVLKEALDWILHILIAVIIGVLIVNFIAQVTIVSGSSMETTLHNGDRLIVDKISKRFTDIMQGDIVTINHPQDILGEHTPIIKRVIGVKGDLVEIKDGKVFVNGKEYVQNYTLGSVTNDVNPQYSKIIVKEGYIYVLGDNRTPSGSLDSRSFGEVSLDKIGGRAWIRIIPFNNFGRLTK